MHANMLTHIIIIFYILYYIYIYMCVCVYVCVCACVFVCVCVCVYHSFPASSIDFFTLPSLPLQLPIQLITSFSATSSISSFSFPARSKSRCVCKMLGLHSLCCHLPK